jgi:homoserine O-acetyltransferase
MNHLLKTIHLTEQRGAFHEIVREIRSEIHLVAINTDYFFSARENRNTYETLKSLGIKTTYHEIDSIHGHDAFLIEFEQMSQFLHPIFSKIKTQNYVSI